MADEKSDKNEALLVWVGKCDISHSSIKIAVASAAQVVSPSSSSAVLMPQKPTLAKEREA